MMGSAGISAVSGGKKNEKTGRNEKSGATASLPCYKARNQAFRAMEVQNW
jgi:hypothetical protein